MLSTSAVVKELLLPIFVYALLLITRFPVLCEEDRWKKMRGLELLRIFSSKRFLQLQNHFPPIFGKSILITLLFIKKTPRD